MTIYRHTQFGYGVVGLLLAGIVLLVAVGLIFGWGPGVIPVLCTLVLLLPFFSFMTVEVGEGRLSFQMGIFPLKKRIPLKNIREVMPVKNCWYEGLGIHLTSGGWLYNVSGTEAVEVHLRSGGSLRIGTDEPAELIAAISRGTAS